MTKKDKELLLKDICERLPYGIIVEYKQKTFSPYYGECEVDTKIEIDEMLHHRLKLLDFKPYLRHLSSMTEKEKEELRDKNILIAISTSGTVETTIDGFDWLNKNMFDYRGLIEKGLALPAPEGMYNIMEGTFKEYADWMQNIGCATCIYVERLFSLWETKDKSKKFKFEFKCTHKNRIVTSNDGQIGRRCRGFIE